MGILSRPLLRPSQRLDLEDWELLLSGLRTDAHYHTKRFFSAQNYVVQGLKISQSFIGQSTADITLDGSVIINGENPDDFSWWTAPDGSDPLTLPTGAGGLQAGRNFVEVQITTEDGTPLQRAFWDPTANSGEGVEFTNEVDTVTDLNLIAVINQTSFTGDADKIPVAIIDLDGSFNIQGIQDKRELFYRLGTPDDINADYNWGSQEEATTELVFTVASGTPFVAGETVTFTSGATATVIVGGTNNITVREFSSINYNPGDAVSGGTSGANATLLSYYESFVGADKDISDFRDLFAAFMTEIKALKGTQFWFEQGNVISLISLLNYVNAFMAPISGGAKFSWNGSSLSITDDATSGQATSDVIARIRIPGTDSELDLTRQDGTGGSAALGIPDGSILYVEFPTLGADRTYSESGNGSTNFQVATLASFIPTDSNFWIAYREGSKLIVRGSGEMQTGEVKQIGDETTKGQLAFTGAEDETDSTPPYTTTPNANLSNQFSTADSLTQGISINAANINDLADALLKPYQEPMFLVGSGSGIDDHDIEADSSNADGEYLAAGAIITIPLDSRDSNTQKKYVSGSGSLFIFLNGQELRYGEDYTETGSSGDLVDEFQILRDIPEGYELDIRIVNPQFFGTSGISQPFFVNYITGQNGNQISVGALYNSGTDKLGVWRNGLFMLNTISVGDLIDRYQEVNNNSISISQTANSSEVFTMVNHEDPQPSVTILTGLTGTTITVPSYVIGSDRLRVFRNGVLMSIGAGVSAIQGYTEASTTTIELDSAAVVSDVFTIWNAGAVPQWRETLTGVTGSTLTIPNSQTFTNGDQRMLVFRNGVLMLNSTTLANAVDRYQENGTTQIDLELAASASDFFEFIYI